MMQENMRVLAHEEIADCIFELKLEGEMVWAITEPGQFVHIRVGGGSQSVAPLLRRPISISSADPSKKTMTLIYRSGGLGTGLLSETGIGEKVDVLGPLGHGFPVEATPLQGKALVIGGGVGIPPLYGLSQELNARGIQVTHVLGFRSAKDVFYQMAFEKAGRTIIMTEDGTDGRRGRVTDVLDSVDFDVAYACGPIPMLKALEHAITEKPLFVSLEQRMGCGIGACMACVTRATDANDAKGYRRVCCDGPVFKAGEVELC
ncbi:dihydroorotate dehydrogenase electron transfer subunit [Sporolactobacillus shoreicorticis]|uniref:Dihydroorotate dehydrogenase B (NAD(+)), electron transfer subunit n=1 Tax=Sporolactobacillus shoreicorticis TaxID=1923877 RepID=A0ABW5SA16_9BACL|nr:dihydroorotate dehydrogenase electron transfer subunit [Sporolactobacillus shoreicorticis]MCO7128119.1 dihydroorotate dehydrogenase electron transfer subunit [Sporolactobacillus shoreicorticis]